MPPPPLAITSSLRVQILIFESHPNNNHRAVISLRVSKNSLASHKYLVYRCVRVHENLLGRVVRVFVALDSRNRLFAYTCEVARF